MTSAKISVGLITSFMLIAPGMCIAKPALAQTITLGGVNFHLPAGLVPQTGRPAPVALSWKNEGGTVSVDALTLPNHNPLEAAKEFQDWPAVGRSMAASFGSANLRALGEAYGAKCKYEGIPVAHDSQRMISQIRVETTCATKPEPTVLRSLVINILTNSDQILFRIDAQPTGYHQAEEIAKEIWKTLRVTEAERVHPIGQLTTGVDVGSAKPVVGGPGFRFTDYSLIRTEALIAELVGALVGAVLLGALISMLFISIGLTPLTSLIGAQILLILVRLWGKEQDGVWELDWIMSIVPAITAVLLLRGWAQRRWEKRQGVRKAAFDRER